MTEQQNWGALPQATLVPRKRTRVSAVWVVPIIAIAVAIGIAVQRIVTAGPRITIVFNSAEGVEAGKTSVKYKDVEIGRITAVRLSDDLLHVELTAEIDARTDHAIVEDARFWIVRPRITLSEISGLGTLLSGNYIGFEPGQSTRRKTRFVGLEVPPPMPGDVSGRRFILGAADLGSIGIGSPVHFRRLRVGQVIGYDLTPDGRSVEVRVFVSSPYEKFVNRGTRFWNASGLNVSLGANGVDIHTESVLALLEGGISFDTPSFEDAAEPAEEDTHFTLHADIATAMKQPKSVSTPYVLYFDESLRGLSVGAPVTLFGLPIGEVTGLGLTFDPVKQNLRGRVHVRFSHESLDALMASSESALAGRAHEQPPEAERALLRRMVDERGMRAALRSGSLISGQMYVALDFFPDLPRATVDWTQPELEMPVVASTLPDIETKVTSILTKLDAVPFVEMGNDLRGSLALLDESLQQVKAFMVQANVEIAPRLTSSVTGLDATVSELRAMIASGDRLLKDAETMIAAPDAPAQLEWRAVMQEVTKAARAFRFLTDYLERHPEALLRGKSDQESR